MILEHCDVCRRIRECQSIQLTPKELEVAKIMDPAAKPVYFYCQQCWHVMNNQEHAARLLQGTMLQTAGHPVSDEVSESVYQKLMEKRKP